MNCVLQTVSGMSHGPLPKVESEWFILRLRVRISARIPTKLTEVFLGFP